MFALLNVFKSNGLALLILLYINNNPKQKTEQFYLTGRRNPKWYYNSRL